MQPLRPYDISEDFICRDLVKRSQTQDYITILVDYINSLNLRVNELESKIGGMTAKNKI